MPEPATQLGQPTSVIDGTCGQCNRDGHGTYLTAAKCRNCDWEGEIRHSLSHEKSDRNRSRCPRCECNTVYPGDFIEREGEAT